MAASRLSDYPHFYSHVMTGSAVGALAAFLGFSSVFYSSFHRKFGQLRCGGVLLPVVSAQYCTCVMPMCECAVRHANKPHCRPLSLAGTMPTMPAASLCVGMAAAAKFHPAKFSCRRCLMARAAARRRSLLNALWVAAAAAAAAAASFLLIKDEEVNMRRLLPDAHVSHHSLWGF